MSERVRTAADVAADIELLRQERTRIIRQEHAEAMARGPLPFEVWARRHDVQHSRVHEGKVLYPDGAASDRAGVMRWEPSEDGRREYLLIRIGEAETDFAKLKAVLTHGAIGDCWSWRKERYGEPVRFGLAALEFLAEFVRSHRKELAAIEHRIAQRPEEIARKEREAEERAASLAREQAHWAAAQDELRRVDAVRI